MAHSYFFIILVQWLVLAAANVYTGFNYGAFWSQSQAKSKADFVRQFNLAKSLPNTTVSFDSARLFTCIQWFTLNDPIEAFEAALETNTTMLLGFWGYNETYIENEISALGKAFDIHGPKLADLVIGLSVGNEDIYRYERKTGLPGASTSKIQDLVQLAREKISTSSFADFMKNKPIGHTDIQDYAPDIKGFDFIGLNAYPYYMEDPIEKANETFFKTLNHVEKKAGDTPVWIGETGWPFSGNTTGPSVPSPENMQRYWTDVGCHLFGKYNTWWFQLELDSPDGADWGLIDIPTQKPRIKDLSCPNFLDSIKGEPPTIPSLPLPSDELTFSGSDTSSSPDTTLMKKPPAISTTQAPNSLPPSSSIIHVVSHSCNSTANHSAPSMSASVKSTVYETTTLFITMTETPSSASVIKTSIIDCLTVADVSGNEQYVAVATNPATNGQCAPPPTYTGLPYPSMPALPTTPDISAQDGVECQTLSAMAAGSRVHVSAIDVHAPTSSPVGGGDMSNTNDIHISLSTALLPLYLHASSLPPPGSSSMPVPPAEEEKEGCESETDICSSSIDGELPSRTPSTYQPLLPHTPASTNR